MEEQTEGDFMLTNKRNLCPSKFITIRCVASFVINMTVIMILYRFNCPIKNSNPSVLAFIGCCEWSNAKINYLFIDYYFENNLDIKF